MFSNKDSSSLMPFSFANLETTTGSTAANKQSESLRESPYTHAWLMKGDWTKMPSSLSGAMYSPKDVLKIFLALSMI